jgi:hypothetical protein
MNKKQTARLEFRDLEYKFIDEGYFLDIGSYISLIFLLLRKNYYRIFAYRPLKQNYPGYIY